MKPEPLKPQPQPRRRSGPVRAVRRLVRLTGWLAILATIAAVVVERTHVAESLLEQELGRRFAPLGSSATVEDVELDWLGPGLTVHGLRVSKDGADLLRAERLYVAVGFTPERGPYLAQLDLGGGRVVIGEDLFADVNALLEGERESAGGPPGELQLPSIQVRDFAVEFEDPARRILPLGRIDVSLEAEFGRPAKLTGRLVLPRLDGALSSPELFLSGLANPSGQIELHTTAHELDLASWDMPATPALALLKARHPRGRLSLHTNGSLHLRGEARARGQLRLALTGGSLEIPEAGAPAEAIEADIESHYRPEGRQGFWDPEAWAGVGTVRARWAGQELEGGFRAGRASHPDSLFESWVHLPGFSVDVPELRTITEPEIVPRLLAGFEPSGIAEAAVGIRSGPGWRPGRPLGPELEIAARVLPHPRLEGAYHGLPNPKKPDEQPLAFPLPYRTYEGAVLVNHNARFTRREVIDVNFVGSHATGLAKVSYQEWSNPIDLPPYMPGYGEREWDLIIVVPGIDLDHHLREHLPGLGQIPTVLTLFEDYGLEGGRVEVTIHVAARAGNPGAPVRADFRVDGVSAAWAQVPVPAAGIHGQVEVVDDGRGLGAVRFELAGETEGTGGFELAGRQRFVARARKSEGSDTVLDVIELHVEAVELGGSTAKSIGEVLPDIGNALRDFAPSGLADVEVIRLIAGQNEPERFWVEVSPIGAIAVDPVIFPVHTDAIRGRVIVELTNPAPRKGRGGGATEAAEASSVTRIVPFVGRWNGEIPIGVQVVARTPGETRGRLFGARTRPSDEALVAKVVTALGTDPERVREETQGLQVAGAVDFDCEFVIPEGAGAESLKYRFFLRENRLDQPRGLHVEELGGVLALEGSRLTSDRLTARLGDTPVELTNFAADTGEGRLRLEADLEAADVSIDQPLLRQFLDPESVKNLVEEFGLRGRLDIDPGHLELDWGTTGELRLVLRGEGTLSDAYLELGLPLSVGSAQVTLEELVFENGEVRGWGRVHNLYGQTMGRDLSGVDLILSYHGSRLTLETLEGSFCQGQVHGLSLPGGEVPGWAGPVFSVDLEAPFVFQAGVALENLDAGLLLEDVFAADLADRGRFSAELRLQGQLQDLLSIRGNGWGEVRDTVLWSVPVLRDLFSRLGFDSTAVFDSMRSDFRVENGYVLMEDVEVHSPLLMLRGRGVLGLDGTLNQDLEVKYALVDKSGPLSGLIYLLQNTLLSVSIRGDMSRPRVFLNSALTGPFAGVDDDWRALPLPGFSALPERF